VSAASEYRARAAARHATFLDREREQFRISQFRLLVFGVAVLLAALAWWGTFSGYWLLAPVAAFAWLVKVHDRTLRARDEAARAEGFYARGLARLEDRWIGTGETGERFRDDDHPYGNDLDLFGRGSLFELLSIARTRAGEEALASWLKAPAGPEAIAARQEAVTELTPALDLREALAQAGSDIRAGVHPDELVAWAEAPPRLAPPRLRLAALLLTATTVAAAAAFALTGSYLPLIAALAVQGVFQHRQRGDVDAVLHGAEAPARDLAVLLHLVTRLERERFRAARLEDLRRRITHDEQGPVHPASAVIGRLQRLVEAHDWAHNLMFTPFAVALMWGTHIAWAIERWRAAHGHQVAAWLRAVGELEALSSISAYRYEHPDDPFPVIVSLDGHDGSCAVFDGESLGHPLIPSARMVRNDVALDAARALLVVSGSNMSGKSTLLRTVGVNAVLALAGAPVRARALRLTPLALGATLRIQDSLQEGRSRFYAEITRIRAVVDLARGPLPLLFLLDELFHGTNSHDRLVGATGVLRSLLDFGAMGLITTHDLALTAVAGDLGGRAANVHFEDRFEGGEMRFDYRMKPGPVTRSNALALMRAVGLDVGENPATPADHGPPRRSGPETGGVIGSG
jgi:hypothetical protein